MLNNTFPVFDPCEKDDGGWGSGISNQSDGTILSSREDKTLSVGCMD